jgi:hypothetical protein
MQFIFDADRNDNQQWKTIKEAYDMDTTSSIQIILGKIPLIGIHHPDADPLGYPIDLTITTINGHSFRKFIKAELGSFPEIMYLRTVGISHDKIATRILVFQDQRSLSHIASIMCERPKIFIKANQILKSIQPNLITKSAHGTLFTNFKKGHIPVGFLDSERAPHHSKWPKILAYANTRKPMILIYIGAGDPEPFQICQPLIYRNLDLRYNVILFSCAKSLNLLQQVTLQYLFQNWAKIENAENPLDILSTDCLVIHNPVSSLQKRLNS